MPTFEQTRARAPPSIARQAYVSRKMRRTTLTETLEIVHEDGGPDDGPVVLLLHGGPDDARTWKDVTPRLNAAGFRTIAPWVRGFGPTRFRSPQTVRDGRAEALAQDAIDLADALGIERFTVVGHDWGARAAYALAAVIPERLTALAALSIGYPRRGPGVPRAGCGRPRRAPGSPRCRPCTQWCSLPGDHGRWRDGRRC